MNELMTSAVRLHGANDIRLERFPLPEPCDDEALLKVITDSLCASTYKAVIQGKNHKRVPDDVDVNPVMVGHELCGELIKVGKNLEGKFFPGEKVIIQPALKLENGHDPGYSYKYVGGATEYAIVPSIVIERGCLLPFSGEGWYKGSLVEAVFSAASRGSTTPIIPTTSALTGRKRAESSRFSAERVRWVSRRRLSP